MLPESISGEFKGKVCCVQGVSPGDEVRSIKACLLIEARVSEAKNETVKQVTCGKERPALMAKAMEGEELYALLGEKKGVKMKT